MPNKENQCHSVCATCPFLRENSGKPNPDGYDAMKKEAEDSEHFYYDWYSEENLRRIWKGGLRNGEPMVCHATDPNAPDYGYDKKPKEGNLRHCVGAYMAVYKHIKYFEKVDGKYKDYRAAAGKYPMPKRGMMAWIQSFIFGIQGLILPKEVSGSSVARIGVPEIWNDRIINDDGE